MHVMLLHSYGISAAGARAQNEDALRETAGAGFQLLVLADGLGGHGGGEIAARICVDEIAAGFAARPSLAPEDLQALANAADAAIAQARQARKGNPHAMRSTLALLAVANGQARFAHIGDSRIYRFRHRNLLQRSRDHSLSEIAAQAGLDPAEGRNRLLRSLGAGVGCQLECSPLIEKLDRDDQFLLCSDGLWNLLPDDNIQACLAGAEQPRSWAAALQAAILAAGGPAGPPDNYSLITAMTAATCQASSPATTGD